MNPCSEDEILGSENPPFDRIPDEILRTVFNKLRDAKSVCLSMSVCKRFHSVAPQVDDVFLSIPRKKAAVPKESNHQETPKRFFKNLVSKALIKPLNFFSQMVRFKSKNDSDSQSFYIPDEVLTSFDGIRNLHLKLPCREDQKQGSKRGKKKTTFLKWNAEFGKELQSCVIFGAKSVTEKRESDDEKTPETRLIAQDELKQRIVWTISCLIAASARHYLIQDMLKNQKTIESLVVSDESDQGRVCMNKEQIEEVRGLSKGIKGRDDDEELMFMMEYRSRVPALRMKMWYLEKMDCGNNKVMEGATLMVIRPAIEAVKGRRTDVDLVAAAFGGGEEEEEEEAVRKLMVAKKSCYTLEMNAF